MSHFLVPSREHEPSAATAQVAVEKRLSPSRFRCGAGEVVILGHHPLGHSFLKGVEQLAGRPLSSNIAAWLEGKAWLYSTYPAFKGLEADVVVATEVIAPCDKFPESVWVNGMSRARHRLVLLG